MDPNVLVSAALSEKGAPWQIVFLWHAEEAFELVVSHELLYELEVVLLREKFRSYLTFAEALEYIVWLHEGGTLAGEGAVVRISTDPEDDYLVALARASGADYLVSGDPHLSGLQSEEPGVRILNPRAFYELLTEGRTEESP